MFEELQNLMGESYNEQMTVEDINNFFKGKKMVDLTKGGYVGIDKYNRIENEKNNLSNQIEALKLNGNKKEEPKDEKDIRISKLEEEIRNGKINNNKMKIVSLTSQGRGKLEIKDDDEEFSKVLNLLASDNEENSNLIGSYLANIINKAYEAGKNEANKQGLRDMSNPQNGSDGGNAKKSLAEELAKAAKSSNNSDYYFK